MRLFFAAWPPAAAAAALHGWAEALRDGKLVKRENIHLTLAFLGEADPARAAAAAKRVLSAWHELPIDEARFILERRPFAAHVRLLRKASAPQALPPLPRVAWPVREFLLVRSRVSANGPTYEPVERFPLKGVP